MSVKALPISHIIVFGSLCCVIDIFARCFDPVSFLIKIAIMFENNADCRIKKYRYLTKETSAQRREE